jgi:hypothetical protein
MYTMVVDMTMKERLGASLAEKRQAIKMAAI